ncbi:hypothetical protein [Candidatus Palauibacter sp.]|uniref:hypothetical protein n=1 Tax=Candidatus Palauibacter sp. TaxID=3101350 RepID=UPI003AF2ED0E
MLTRTRRALPTSNVPVALTGTSCPVQSSPEISRLANLGTLVLGNNNLTGPIPTELGNLSNLGTLVLGNNNLTGSIPTELGNLSNLGTLLASR